MRHSAQMDASPPDLPTGLPTLAATPVTWLRYLPQKLHRRWVASSATGCRGPSAVTAACPERMTSCAFTTHFSQIYTPGPTMSLLTGGCDRPQNEQARSAGRGP